jgi:hypothetical protein
LKKALKKAYGVDNYPIDDEQPSDIQVEVDGLIETRDTTSSDDRDGGNGGVEKGRMGASQNGHSAVGYYGPVRWRTPGSRLAVYLGYDRYKN